MIRKKIAVVGTGSIGIRHLKMLQKLDVETWAIPKRAERVAELKAQEFLATSSLQEASKQGVNAAVIASDTGCHTEDARQALELGMDLLIEKPLAVDQQSSFSILQLARKLNKKVSVACVLRFSESLNLFKSLLAKIGFVHSVEIQCSSYLPDWRPNRDYRQSYSAKKEEGGVLRDLIHEIDYVTWIFGWPQSVLGNLKNLGRLGIEAEEVADLSWKTPSKTDVSLHLDYISKTSVRTMSALGEKGVLVWDAIVNQVSLKLSGAAQETFQPNQQRDTMYFEQLKAFLFSTESQLTTGPEGVRALALCDAARNSSQLRKEETIHYLI